jgi:hypothetical protein
MVGAVLALILAHLQGERTPYWGALPAGTLFGLNPDHGREALCAAVLEGVLLQLRVIVEHFAAQGRTADPLFMPADSAPRRLSNSGWPQRSAGRSRGWPTRAPGDGPWRRHPGRRGCGSYDICRSGTE